MTPDILELIASICEIIGAFLTANALLGNIHKKMINVPLFLVSALYNGTLSNAFQRAAGLTSEDHRRSLRGLAFIALGFTLKFVAIAWKIGTEHHVAAPL
ncbi:MAG: hypothetical protein ABI988_09590 [Nitrospirota bacterium]